MQESSTQLKEPFSPSKRRFRSESDLTTEAVVANKPEPAAPAGPGMDPSTMGGMM